MHKLPVRSWIIPGQQGQLRGCPIILERNNAFGNTYSPESTRQVFVHLDRSFYLGLKFSAAEIVKILVQRFKKADPALPNCNEIFMALPIIGGR